jgi:hypothetical protein
MSLHVSDVVSDVSLVPNVQSGTRQEDTDNE